MSTSIETVEQLLDRPESASAQSHVRSIQAPSSFEWLFVLTGGLAFALPLLFWVGEQSLGQEELIHWYFWIGSIVSAPHVYATYVRLHRKIQDGSVAWWMGFPWYFAWAALLVVSLWAGFYVQVLTAINVWQSWHYLRQTYGVSCLYGQQTNMDNLDRRIRYWAYHFTFPWLIIGRWDMLYTIWNGKTSDAIIPVDFGVTVMYPLGLVALAGIYLAVVGEIRLIIKNKWNYRPIGLLCYAICIGIHWYGFLIPSHYQRGFFAVTIFHAIQYMALIWHFERQTAIESGNKIAISIPTLVGFMAFWGLLYLVGCGFEQQFLPFVSHWWADASTILLAAISAHHYSVDTFIWRRNVGK